MENVINRKITGSCTHEENEDFEIQYSINASYEEKMKNITDLRIFFFGKELSGAGVNKSITGIRELYI